MKYVLDASVALKVVLSEPDSGKALVLFDEFRRGVHEFHVPDIFPAELAHALTRAERKCMIAVGDAVLHLARLLRPMPKIHSSLALLAQATNTSSQLRICCTTVSTSLLQNKNHAIF